MAKLQICHVINRHADGHAVMPLLTACPVSCAEPCLQPYSWVVLKDPENMPEQLFVCMVGFQEYYNTNSRRYCTLMSSRSTYCKYVGVFIK